MKRIISFIAPFLFLLSLNAQPEINCDTIYNDPQESAYILPYANGKTYNVTQSNCFPNGGHNLTFAYDFNTQIGDTILACRAGTVTFTNDQYEDTDWESGHENNVFIGHSDNTRIRYTHLKKGGVLVNVGDQVEQGQAIGISGNSGNTGGFPHLHLSAFKDNTSFNRQNTIPINFCNTNDPVNNQNLLIMGQSYTAIDKNITDIEEMEILKTVSVFPNPANRLLNIELKDLNLDIIQLFNINGQLVYDLEVENNLELQKIPIDNLDKGMYFLVLKTNTNLLSKKVIVF